MTNAIHFLFFISLNHDEKMSTIYRELIVWLGFFYTVCKFFRICVRFPRLFWCKWWRWISIALWAMFVWICKRVHWIGSPAGAVSQQTFATLLSLIGISGSTSRSHPNPNCHLGHQLHHHLITVPTSKRSNQSSLNKAPKTSRHMAWHITFSYARLDLIMAYYLITM